MIQQCQRCGTVASDQPEYSLLKRDIEQDVLPFCHAQGIGVLAYKPILQGLLSGKVTMDRTFPEDDYRVHNPWFRPDNRARVLAALETLKPLAAAYHATLSQLVINWTVNEPGVTAAIVGARNPAQARENAAAVRFRPKDDERALIRRTFEQLGAPQ
jgi:aryl-alcohol dehydrogenase-like predicted oxidoreductase